MSIRGATPGTGGHGSSETPLTITYKSTYFRDDKVEHHRNICKKLNETYECKNHDYGDSFHKSYLEEGLVMARIRLGDKYNRFCALSRKGAEQKVDDESIIDTLLDMANYAIMTVMELSEGTEDGATAGLKLDLEPKDPHDEVRTVSVFGSRSPQDATQGLSGEGGDRIGVYKKITADDIVETYRMALEEANEATMSALDRVIAAGKESFGAFEAEIDEEEDDEEGLEE